MTYRVYMETTVGLSVEVEADSAEEAERKAELEGLPQVMTLDHRYPDMGEWEAVEAEEV